MSHRRLVMLTIILLSTVTCTALFIISPGKDLTESSTSKSHVLGLNQTVITGSPNSTDLALDEDTVWPMWFLLCFVAVLLGIILGFITGLYDYITAQRKKRHADHTYDTI